MKYIIILMILISTTFCLGQSIDKSFSGNWARTSWSFSFSKDNSYSRTSSGHFGNTSYSGVYERIGDTIYLLTGSEKISGIKNSKYLLDKDSFLIDLQLYYDYRINDKAFNYYSSRKRYDILEKPNMDSLIVIDKRQFENIIHNCVSLLKSHRFYEIKDFEHVNVVRLINSVKMSQEYLSKDGSYAEFLKLLKDTEYENKISIYYDYVESRGMGLYLQKLQIELGGAPHSFSFYTIKND